MLNSTCGSVQGVLSLNILPIFATFAMSICGLFFSVLLMKVLLRIDGSVPTFVKYSLVNLTISTIMRNLFSLYKSVYMTLILNNGFERMMISYVACASEQYFVTNASMCRYITLFWIGVDRLKATLEKPSAMHHSSSKNHIAVIFLQQLFLSWFPSTLLYGLATHLSKPYFDYPDGICYCYMPRIWQLWYNNMVNIAGMVMNIVILFIYVVVYWKNAIRLRKIHIETMKTNLNRRFIEWSCVKITKWLIPLTIISILPIGVVMVGFTICRLMGHEKALATFEASIFIVVLFACDAGIYSYVCIWLSPLLLQMIRQNYPSLCWLFWQKIRTRSSEKYARSSQSKITISHVRNVMVRYKPQARHVLNYRVSPETQAEMMEKMWQQKN